MAHDKCVEEGETKTLAYMHCKCSFAQLIEGQLVRDEEKMGK